MNTKSFHLFIGGVLIVAVASTSPWTAIAGVSFLWIVHRRAVGNLSKTALFRSVAAGGIAVGFITSTVTAAIPLVVKNMMGRQGHNPVDDDALLSKVTNWVTFASAGYVILTALLFALLFAWAATLVAPHLSAAEETAPKA